MSRRRSRWTVGRHFSACLVLPITLAISTGAASATAVAPRLAPVATPCTNANTYAYDASGMPSLRTDQTGSGGFTAGSLLKTEAPQVWCRIFSELEGQSQPYVPSDKSFGPAGVAVFTG